MTITFKSRTYKVVKSLPITPMLKAEGMSHQFIIEGVRGATKLYQEFTNGIARTITTSGRVEQELVAVSYSK